MDWHERASGRILLRLGGLALLALGWVIGGMLRRHAIAGPVVHDAAAYLLATIVFVSVGSGAALTIMGAHLFDKVEIAGRWRRPDLSDLNPPLPARASPPSPAAPAPAPRASAAAHPAPDAPTARAAASPGDPP